MLYGGGAFASLCYLGGGEVPEDLYSTLSGDEVVQ